jgi:hypothetical protein
MIDYQRLIEIIADEKILINKIDSIFLYTFTHHNKEFIDTYSIYLFFYPNTNVEDIYFSSGTLNKTFILAFGFLPYKKCNNKLIKNILQNKFKSFPISESNINSTKIDIKKLQNFYLLK